MAPHLWGQQKTPLSEEKWSKPYGKTLFWQSCVFLAQWKGGLLRGKVSQGSTSPLKPCVKGLKVRALKRLNDFSHAVFTLLQSVVVMALGMALRFAWRCAGGVKAGR